MKSPSLPALAVVFSMLAPASARAACTASEYPDLDDRLDCFDTFLGIIDANMGTVTAGQTTITGLISTQATRLNNVQSAVSALQSDVAQNAGDIAAVVADYLRSADLAGLATEAYVDGAVGANTSALAALEVDLAAVLADYLTSADLSGLASEVYVDDAVAGAGGGVPGLSDYVWVDAATDRVVFEGANVHIQSGSGATDDGGVAPWGLGNLIVGYDEARSSLSDKSGSHNLVVGPNHNYPGVGGLVAGHQNAVVGSWASVTGGRYNEAIGSYASVSGGIYNQASGLYAWGRVDRGGCPPRPPTDPDVRNSRIRLFGSHIRQSKLPVAP